MKKSILIIATLALCSCVKKPVEPVNPTTEEINESLKVKWGHVIFTSAKPGLMTVITSNQYTYSNLPIFANGNKCENVNHGKYEVHPGVQTYTVYSTKINEKFNYVADTVYKIGTTNVAYNSCNTIQID